MYPFFSPLSRIKLMLVGIMLLALQTAMAQVQKGSAVWGSIPFAYLGESMALSDDGTHLVTGAPGSYSILSHAGMVRVFQWAGTDWTQVGTDIGGVNIGDRMGQSVAISADGLTIATGSPHYSNTFGLAGQVRMFRWIAGSWQQLGTAIEGGENIARCGWDVALSDDGNRCALSIRDNDSGGLTNAGEVHVYEWSGTNWNLMGAPIIGVALEQSGWSIDLSADGTRLAIGGPSYMSYTGRVRMYDWDGSAWIQVGSDIMGNATGDNNGYSVALSESGHRVIMGAYGHNSSAGQARAFEWNGNNWVQVGTDIDGQATGDACGFAVAISMEGNRMVVGSQGNDANGNMAGSTRVFEWTGGNWIQNGAAILGSAAGDFSGISVAAADESHWVGVGAFRNNDGGADAGEVRVFDMGAGSLLSARFQDFQLINTHEKVFLTWTLENANGGYFEIEHSQTTEQWEKVGQMPISAKKTVHSFPRQPSQSGTHFYRIVALNLEGKKTYSEVRKAVWGEKTVLQVYPNPGRDQVTIMGETEGRFSVWDMKGKKVLAGEFSQGILDFSSLPTGLYTIRLWTKNGAYTQKWRKE